MHHSPFLPRRGQGSNNKPLNAIEKSVAPTIERRLPSGRLPEPRAEVIHEIAQRTVVPTRLIQVHGRDKLAGKLNSAQRCRMTSSLNVSGEETLVVVPDALSFSRLRSYAHNSLKRFWI